VVEPETTGYTSFYFGGILQQWQPCFFLCRITFRVAEPEGLARRLPHLANGVTDQGLGEVTSAARNGAGKPVLAEGAFHRYRNCTRNLPTHRSDALVPKVRHDPTWRWVSFWLESIPKGRLRSYLDQVAFGTRNHRLLTFYQPKQLPKAVDLVSRFLNTRWPIMTTAKPDGGQTSRRRSENVIAGMVSHIPRS